ncbi:NADase-type glycan-binding domain-containing protein [Streptomyces sp. AM6-12]|uniref:NADase-type glycan-binding domain-containing protein n=1 Tax=Streptomyces sp. AM6-12 TaxID=3345149 RepID=UPI00379DC59F
MRACPACGASNGSDDDFCGNCGAYLGWSSEGAARTPVGGGNAPADEGSSPPATPEIDSRPNSRTAAASSGSPAADTRSRAEERRTTRTDTDAGPVQAPPVRGTAPTASGESGAPPARSTPPAPPAPPAPRTAPERAAATTPRTPPATPTPPASPEPRTSPPSAPAAPPPRTPPAAPAPRAPRAPEPVEPEVHQPAPVLPGKPVAPRPVVRPVERRDEVVGPPCPACGTPNPPGRRFCRRCATPLNPQAAPAPLPWWRTVWPFRRRVRAGSGRWVRVLVILLVVLALGVGGFLLLPAGRALFEDTRDKLAGTKAVTATRVTASAAVPGHPASNTKDGLSNRYWGAPGPGASVTYTFGKPFRLVDLIITNGASDSPEQYATEARALQMDMEVTSSDGTVHHKSISLNDKAGPQTVQTGIDDVVRVRLVLHSVTGLTAGRHVAVAEVEFFQRS